MIALHKLALSGSIRGACKLEGTILSASSVSCAELLDLLHMHLALAGMCFYSYFR